MSAFGRNGYTAQIDVGDLDVELGEGIGKRQSVIIYAQLSLHAFFNLRNHIRCAGAGFVEACVQFVKVKGVSVVWHNLKRQTVFVSGREIGAAADRISAVHRPFDSVACRPDVRIGGRNAETCADLCIFSREGNVLDINAWNKRFFGLEAAAYAIQPVSLIGHRRGISVNRRLKLRRTGEFIIP